MLLLNDHEDEEAEDNQIDDKYLLGFLFKIYYTDRELSIDFTFRENCNQQWYHQKILYGIWWRFVIEVDGAHHSESELQKQADNGGSGADW